ncbi:MULTISPECIES: TipJ family phage tail tip protein [unclassified Providencia]|uniref:TipJ family phage tail tip protein n=1 Tax=unclassified Providencia TaxID=2633465 RepID=UPI00234B19A3|nr:MULTISPECIES: phage tail protein [unclassified Providencia]
MSSGGGKAKTPILLNDNLKSKQFLRVLDLISEGPIYGPVDTEHMSSIMLNKTPVTNKNGDISINGVAAAWRNGSEYQEPINGFDYLESTVMVNNAVTKETPLVRTITNQEVDRVRLNIGVSSLVKTDSSGNQENSSVQMAIEVKSGNGGYVTQKIVTIGPNKISGEYLEAHIIEAPEQKPFDLRVRRITEDSNSDSLQNGTIWNSYTEITDDRLSYPFSAIVGVVIDRDQFKDTPTRNYHYRGLIVDVPDNYDPINRTYNGVWLGGFKQAWTNNPAWLYRALIKNNRYGLAKRVGFVDIDDGRLYALSQFCDQLVNDGHGGKEPRFTLNAYLTSQEKAKVILDKIASSLRGSSVWDGSYFSMLIDMPSDPVALITNSNVIDGKFTRNSTPSDERYNAVIVSWVDPNNGWETSKEYVADDVSIANDGYKETTIEAFGCTSRGQAYRVGKWLLETSLRETGRISFSMARDAISFMPCDIVEIADNQHIGTRVSGRVISRNKRIITVDAPIEINEQSITFSMMGAHGKPVKFDVDYIDGNKIHLLSEPEYFKEHSPFVISAKNLKTKLYRITSVKEEEGNGKYKISAAEHNPNKQAIVDEGAVFDQPTNTINGYRAPSIERLRVISVNSPTVQTTVAWESSTVTKDLSFEVRVYSNNGNVVFEDETDLFSYNFFGLNAGNYFVGVKAKIINGMKGAESQIEMNIGAPPKPTHIQIDSMHFALKATPYISTDNSINTVFEFWGSEQRVSNVADIETKTKRLGRGSFWIKDGLKEGQDYWFYIRSINPFGVSDFVEATGKPDNVIAEVIDELGDTFLTNEAGQKLQEQIDFNQSNVQLQLEQAAEATLNNTVMLNQVSFRLLEEEGTRRSEIFRLEQVRISDQEALARWQQQVKTDYEQTSSAVLKVQESVSTLEKSTAKDISQVKAEIKQVDDKLGPMDARITDQSEAIAKVDETQTKHIETAESRFTDNEALINQLSRSLANAESSLAEMGMQLTAEVGNQAIEQLRIKASITRLDTVTADKFQAFAQSFEKIEAQFNDVNSSITTLKKTVSDNERSQAEINELIKSEIGENKAAIEQRGQTIFDHNGNGSAIYTIKTGINWNNQYYDAKFMMGAEVRNGKVVTQIGFSADTFGIFNPASGKLEPVFFVENGQVFINEAFINQATIEKLLIGSTIKSKNWDPSAKKGLMLDFENGKLIANDAEITGKIYATDGDFRGTVHAEKFIGDVATGVLYEGVSKYFIKQSVMSIETSIIYVGNMPYDVDLIMPTMHFSSEHREPAINRPFEISVFANGVSQNVITTTVNSPDTTWAAIASCYIKIPKYQKDTVIKIRLTGRGNGGDNSNCTLRIHPALVLACKSAPSSFK